MENRPWVQLASFIEELGQIFPQISAKPVGIHHSQLKEGIDLYIFNTDIVFEELTFFINFFNFHIGQ